MEIVPYEADDDEEPYEDLGGSYNAGNRATNDEFAESALHHLEEAGARVVKGSHRVGPIRVGAQVEGQDGKMWLVLMHGTVDNSKRAGMRRTDTLRKAGFDVTQLRDAPRYRSWSSPRTSPIRVWRLPWPTPSGAGPTS